MKLATSFLLLASSALAADMQTHRDRTYSEEGHKLHTLDVYAPIEGKDHPVVFWIHGGGWQAGDKTDVQVKPQAFVDKGFVFVSTNYRLLPYATIILHVAEHPETKGQSNRLVRVLQEAGFEASAYPAEGKDHVSLNDDLGTPNDEPTKVLIEFVNGALSHFGNVQCEGTYRHHLQGICTNDNDAIDWSFTTTLVKTDTSGHVTKKIEVANHHGDLCHHNGRIYVAVNLGKFNDPQGNADSWVYVYNADDLTFVSKHKTQEVFHGAGGIGYRDGRFFVVGGLPDGFQENYVYEYDAHFKFIKKHVIKSGHTHLGIQTAAFAHDRWWFGCYGDPKILLVTDSDFNMLGRYEFDCSLGIVGIPDGRFLSASGRSEKDICTGSVLLAVADEKAGLRIIEKTQAEKQP